MQAGFAGLAKEMAAARNTGSLTDNAKAYSSQLASINSLRDGYTKLVKDGDTMRREMVPGFNQLMQATNGFRVETIQTVSGVQAMTKSIMDQKVKVTDAIGNFKKFRSEIRAVANEQEALKKASVMQWSQGAGVNGKSTIDLYLPTNQLATAKTLAGTWMSTLQAMGTATQNWGKNTQWAGRQITAGFTMPLALAAAGLGVLANKADQELTRITKVMNTVQVSNDPFVQQESNLKQYATARDQAMQTGITMAKQYGATLTDTLSLQADLAALGKTGNDLQTTTAQVVRISTLGELDYNTALQTTISLMNAFKMSSKDLGDAFNYMNAIENSTSLTTQDFAKAIPIAANAMANLGVTFQQFGTMMVAGQSGGVTADQMAQALKSATARILTPTKAAQKAFNEIKDAVNNNGKGIDIQKVVDESNGNLYDTLMDLGKRMAGASDQSKMTAIKQLFGTYQFNKVNTAMTNILDAVANPNDPNNQTAVAMKVANQPAAQWAAIADQEIQTFQKSASGKLKIAVATIKAQLTGLGTPILNALTPVIHGLGNLISMLQDMPSWLKHFAGVGLTIGSMVGPIMMLVGIAANWIGSMTKMVAMVGKLFLGEKMLTPELKAQAELQKVVADGMNAQITATGELAAKMGDLVDIMNARIKAQEELNAATEAAAIADNIATSSATGLEAAEVAETAATNTATTATKENAAAVVSATEAILTLRNASAAMAASGASAIPTFNQFGAGAGSVAQLEAQAKRAGGMMLYHGGLPITSTLDDINLNRNGSQQNKRGRSYGGFYLTDESSKQWSEQYAASRNGNLSAFQIKPDATILDLNKNIDRLSAAERSAYASTADLIKGFDTLGRSQYLLLNKNAVTGMTNSAASATSGGVFAVGSSGQAAFNMNSQRRAIAEAQQASAAAGSKGSIWAVSKDGTIVAGKDAERFTRAQGQAVQRSMNQWINNGNEMRSNPSGAGKYGSPSSYVGSPADYWTSIRGGNVSVGTVPAGMNPSVAAAAAAGVSRQAEESVAKAKANSQQIAANAEKTSASWARTAGSLGALAIGGMMIKDMADGSGSIATNILQATLAFSMLAPVGVQIVGSFKKMAAAAAETGVSGAAGVSVMGAAFSKLKGVATSVFTGIASAAKWLFTTGPGLMLAGLAAIAIAFYTINEQMTKAARAQEKINDSTSAWQQIIGYTAKNTIGADGTIAKGASAYLARANAVKQLAEQNQSLVDSMAEAKDTAKGMDKVYNMALNEALKVKIDGGSSTQAKMAFDVALQAAGLKQAEIDKLDLKIGKINLDDPEQLAQQLNSQVQAALAPQATENKQGGWWEQHWNAFFGGKSAGSLGRLFGGNHYTGLSDQAKAAALQAGQAVYDGIANGLESGDKGQIDSAMKSMNASINNEFAQDFGTIRARGNNATVFKKFGISTMTGLRDAINKAVSDQKKGVATKAQKDLLDAFNNTGVAKMDEWQGFQDTWKTMLRAIGQADGLSGKALDNFVNKTSNSKAVEDQFIGSMKNGKNAANALGDAFQNAADGAATLADAMNTDGAIASGSQYANEMKSAYGGAISDYTSQMSEAFSQAQQRTADAIQAGSDARQKAWQAQQKQQDAAFDAEDKAIQNHYKNLGKLYDSQIKKSQDDAKAQIDAINAKIDALKKEDTTRQELFNNEKTRLQRMAQMFSNNVDYNSALNSGNLDEAAKIYTNNQSTVQGWAADDAQTALDKATQAQEDALSKQIDAIQAKSDAYVAAVQAEKDALSDQQQAEEDALKKRQQDYDDMIAAKEQADQTYTSKAIQNSNNRYQRDKESIDQQIAAITAFVPQSVDQVNKQISQINGAYGNYGNQLSLYGQSWSKLIGNNLEYNIAKAANGLQSDIGWSQIGTFIQQQIDAGANFTLDQALTFLKTGKWPNEKQTKAKKWSMSPALANNLKESGLGVNTSHNVNGVARASHSGGIAGNGGEGMTHGSRVGVPLNAPMFPSEYLTLLRHGEFVVNKSATERNRGLLEAINSGKVDYTGLTVRHGGGVIGTAIAGNAMLHADIMAKAGKQAATDAYGSAIMAAFGGGGGPYSGPITASIQQALNFARSQQGKPYIWGGAGPAGQDCSGFMSVVYNYLTGQSPRGDAFPWGRDWVTASFANGREFGPWKRGNGSNHAFRIGVTPGSHMAGTLGGINIESGSGHGPMVGGKALGSSSGFDYQYYLPAADLPQLYKGGTIQYDNTLANLHKGETVLTAPLTEALTNNVANGLGSTYNVTIDMTGATIAKTVDMEKAVESALYKLDAKNGRSRTIS